MSMKSPVLYVCCLLLVLASCKPALYESFYHPNAAALTVNGEDRSALVGGEYQEPKTTKEAWTRVKKKKGDYWHGLIDPGNFHVLLSCDGEGNYNGQVLDSTTGEPAPWVSVFLRDDERVIEEQQADFDGQFSFYQVDAPYMEVQFGEFETMKIPLDKIDCAD